MFDPKDFPFNAEKMTEFFKNNNFATGFTAGKFASNTEDLFESQKKNMEALVAANKAAAQSYQELFAKQLEVFETTMAEAGKLDVSDLTAKGELGKAAFEKALENMSDLATGAQKANAEAVEIVTARVQESVMEIQALAKKVSK